MTAPINRAAHPLAGKFRKKPVVIDAWAIDYNNTPYPDWVEAAFAKDETETGAIEWCPSGEGLYINTLEGHMRAAVGDVLIRGVVGEVYACRADIFSATYEPAHLADITAAPADSFPSFIAQLAYGWLWHVTTSDHRVHAARKALLSRLSRDDQRAGIRAAREAGAAVDTAALEAAMNRGDAL